MVPGGNGEVGSDDNARARTPKTPPKMHMCYICGKEFGSKSLVIHEVQCLKKFQEQQALLPVEHRKPGVCLFVCVCVCVFV
jgi:DNA polymerase III delta prime subunit